MRNSGADRTSPAAPAGAAPTAPRVAKPREKLTLAEARRAAVAAQGLAKPRPERVTAREVRKTIGQLGLLQIDSVNVLVRAHYMPLFSRLGPYDPALLEADAGHGASNADGKAPARQQRRLFEYWAHEASLVPVDLYPLFRWRMQAAERGEDIYGQLARFAVEQRPYINALLARIRADGPVAASDVEEGNRGAGGWWGWSRAKTALEWLFWSGQLTTRRREVAGFTRIYDVPERVLPDQVLSAPAVDRAEAHRTLLRHAIGALGVATETDLRDYFRLAAAETRVRLAELAEAGSIVPVAVEGWSKPAWLDPDLRIPRRVETAGFLSPFDPLVWERSRSERLFDFHYRIEIYTPAPKRQFGYYCLPFRLGDRIVGRLDLKADRTGRVLLVEAAHLEPSAAAHADEAAVACAGELAIMARWLGLDGVRIATKGSMAKALRTACR